MKRPALQGNPLHVTAFLLVLLLGAVITSGIFLYGDKARILRSANQRLEGQVWVLAEHMERLLDAIDTTFLRLSRELGGVPVASLPVRELEETVHHATTYLPDLANVVVLDDAGRVCYVMHPGRGAAIAERYAPYFRQHRDNWAQAIIAARPPGDNELGSLYFGRRLQDAKGRFTGVLLAEIVPAAYLDGHRHYNRHDTDGMLLLDASNHIIAGWPSSLLQVGEPFGPGVFSGVVHALNTMYISPGQIVPYEDKNGYALMHNMARYPLKVVVGYRAEALFGEWMMRRNWLVAIIILFTVVGVWVAVSTYNQRQLLARAREVLQRREKDYRLLAENFPSGVIMLFNPDGRITIAEGQGLEAMGLHRVRMEGHRPDAFFPEDAASLFQMHHGFVLDGKYTTFNVAMHGRVYQAHALPLLNGTGEVESGMTVLTDVTRREEYETALRRAKEAAENASTLKGQFVANISHELRTPISGIMGITEVALSEGPPEKWRRHFTIIKNVADNLVGVINDVLDFSRIEAGKMSLDVRAFNLHDLVADILEAMRLRARQKNVELDAEYGHGIESWLEGDPCRLRQVLVNLVDNAIKFTEPGGSVRVSLTLAGAAFGRQGLRFAVSDTGIGIPEKRLGDLFDSFSQVDGTLTRQHGGSGLGLSICRRLVDLMGGNLRVRSVQGEGSTFFFSLSLAVHIPPAGSKEVRIIARDVCGADTVPPMRILLAEDNELNQEFLTYFLEDDGHTVVPVANGDEAVRRVQAGDVDIVLMDVQMPVLSGIQATRMIREMPGDVRRIPIVALTAHAMTGDRERFLREGMDAFVGKPVNKEHLFIALRFAWETAVTRGWRKAPEKTASASAD